MKRKVTPLDSRRMRLRGDDEPSDDEVIAELAKQLGRDPVAAEVRLALDVADAQAECAKATIQ